MFAIGFVGSRKYKNHCLVEELVDALPDTTTVVSGGCIGVDTTAVDRAKPRLVTIVHLPKTEDKEGYFERNKLIATSSDFVYAFIPRGQLRSGAWNTINWCRRYKVPYEVLDEEGKQWDRKWKS